MTTDQDVDRSSGGTPGERLRQIEQRLDEIRRRRAELRRWPTAKLADVALVERADLARGHASVARQHAQVASQRAAAHHLDAAARHEALALVLERTGDPAGATVQHVAADLENVRAAAETAHAHSLN